MLQARSLKGGESPTYTLSAEQARGFRTFEDCLLSNKQKGVHQLVFMSGRYRSAHRVKCALRFSIINRVMLESILDFDFHMATMSTLLTVFSTDVLVRFFIVGALISFRVFHIAFTTFFNCSSGYFLGAAQFSS